MSFWNKFNFLNLPDSKEVIKIPGKIKETSTNVAANRITVRYFTNDFSECLECVGEITRDTNIPLIIFNTPNIRGAVIKIDKFTYINRSRDNELTIDVSENYPYGIDKNCDLSKYNNVEYYNNFKGNLTAEEQMTMSSKDLSDCKFFIPVMLNNIPLPIIRLDDADRLSPIDKKYVKKLANVSQSFLRDISDVKLLQRVGSKNTNGYIYIAILFLIIGAFFGLILSAFIM